MKVVINACYGGFSLSPLAVKEMAKINGKECYFFDMNLGSREYKRITLKEAGKSFCFSAFSVKNPQVYKLNERDKDGRFKTANERADKISLKDRNVERHDKTLISVVEKLGKKASGKCAELKIIEIPDGMDYQIEEYDGYEHIAEKHKTWS